MFHQACRSNLTRFSFGDLEWFLPFYHLLLTILAEQSHIKYGRNLVAGRMSDAHNEVDCDQCRFQHHEGSKPSSLLASHCSKFFETYPHSSVQSSSNLIILFESGTAAQNLWQPELAYGTFHVANFALSRRWGFHPL